MAKAGKAITAEAAAKDSHAGSCGLDNTHSSPTSAASDKPNNFKALRRGVEKARRRQPGW